MHELPHGPAWLLLAYMGARSMRPGCSWHAIALAACDLGAHGMHGRSRHVTRLLWHAWVLTACVLGHRWQAAGGGAALLAHGGIFHGAGSRPGAGGRKDAATASQRSQVRQKHSGICTV